MNKKPNKIAVLMGGSGEEREVSLKSGKAIRNAKLRIVRDDETVYKGKLTSLKRNKDDASEVKEGYECGIGVQGFTDFHEGDIIEVYEIKEIKRTL